MIPRSLSTLVASITTTFFFWWMFCSSDHLQLSDNNHLFDFKKCVKKNKVAFLKTHKCASSSLQNIFMRYGLDNHLNFVLPRAGNYLGRLTKYSRSVIRKTPWERAGMDYQIFCLHTIWNYEEVSKTLGANTTYLTIIRDPVDLFESLWVYARMYDYYKTDLETFALSPKTGLFASRAYKRLGRNQMLWDFGLDAKSMDNVTSVKNKIDEIDKTFHLVMMAERFDESMILLMEELCWSYQDVANFKLNVRKESKKTTLTPEARAALQEYLASDFLLYDHFKAKFEARVIQFGLQSMSRELSILRSANEHLQSKCELKEADNDKIFGVNKWWGPGLVAYTSDYEAGPARIECQRLILSELNFIDKLRNVQFARASRLIPLRRKRFHTGRRLPFKW